MKTTTLAVLLSVLSLGGVAMLYVKVDDLGEQMKMSRPSRDSSERTRAGEAQPEYVIRKDDASVRQGENKDPAVAEIKPKSVEQRLTQLERRYKERGTRTWSPSAFRSPRFARNVSDLGKQLKLTATQKDRIENAVSRGNAPPGLSVGTIASSSTTQVRPSLSVTRFSPTRSTNVTPGAAYTRFAPS